MSVDIQIPFRLGFFLEIADVKLTRWPAVRYRGVDRRFLPSLEDIERLRLSGQGRIARLWDRYWSVYDSSQLAADLGFARELLSDFRAESVDLELIYADIVSIPDSRDLPHGALWSDTLRDLLLEWTSTHEQLSGPPDEATFLGFDLSHPIPSFHSAIFQPGLHETQPNLPRYLNEQGLFDDFDSAKRFLGAANEMDYGLMPFCVLRVWSII